MQAKRRFDQFIGREADVHEDRLGPFVQPLDVRAEERHAAIHEPQALPHAVAKDEAGVKNRHHRLGAGHQLAVHRDEDVQVARIDLDVVDGFGHGVLHRGSCRVPPRHDRRCGALAAAAIAGENLFDFGAA